MTSSIFFYRLFIMLTPLLHRFQPNLESAFLIWMSRATPCEFLVLTLGIPIIVKRSNLCADFLFFFLLLLSSDFTIEWISTKFAADKGKIQINSFLFHHKNVVHCQKHVDEAPLLNTYIFLKHKLISQFYLVEKQFLI